MLDAIVTSFIKGKNNYLFLRIIFPRKISSIKAILFKDKKIEEGNEPKTVIDWIKPILC